MKDLLPIVPAALRVRSHFSHPSGPASPAALVARAAELGHAALAITETGTLVSLDEFLDAAEAQGIAAHTGAEVLVRLRRGSAPHPLLLLCATETGYGNLSRLLSLDDPGPEDLFRLREGLIALTGFAGSEPAVAIGRGRLSAASRALVALADLFPSGSAFLALESPAPGSAQDPGLLLTGLAARCGLEPVATGGFDLARPEEEAAARLLTRVRGTSAEDPAGQVRLDFAPRWAAMSAEGFRAIPARAIANAAAVAERLWRPTRRPVAESGESPAGGAGATRPGEPGRRFVARLEAALETACAGVEAETAGRMRARYAEEREALGTADAELLGLLGEALPDDSPGVRAVGRAFGSSSFLHYLAEFSPADPIREKLSPDPSTVGHPEIQIGSSEWEGLAHRLTDAAGEMRLAHPVVVERFTPRGLLAPIARAFGIEGPDVSRVAAELPAERSEFVRLLRGRPDLRRALAALPHAHEVLEGLLALDGAPRLVRTDPRVVLLAPASLDGVAPRFSAGPRDAAGVATLELTRRAASRLGIAYAVIRRSRHLDALLPIASAGSGAEIRWDDRRVWDEIVRADTVGVPYLEGRSVRAALKRERPRSLDELASLLARTLAGGGAISAPGESMVFREDGIALIEKVAGLTGADARELLDALASGDAAGLGRARMVFVRGAANHGTALEDADAAFGELARAAGTLRPKGIYLALARQAYLDLVAKRFDPRGYLERELATPGVRRERRLLLAEEVGRFRSGRRAATKGSVRKHPTKERTKSAPPKVGSRRRVARVDNQLGLFGSGTDSASGKTPIDFGPPATSGVMTHSGRRARACQPTG